MENNQNQKSASSDSWSRSSTENDDYKRAGVQLGASSDDENTAKGVKSGTQHGGGGAGYDAGQEREQIKEEREDMHNERDLGDLNVERQQTSTEENPGRTTEPATPAKEPGGNKSSTTDRSQSGAWSQSSWDPNN